MIPEGKLAERARDIATAVAGTELGAPVRLRTEGAATDWNKAIHRHVFEQSMAVWKPFALLDVILDGKGTVIGYVDHEGYRRAEERITLSDDEVRALVFDEELLPPYGEIVGRASYPGPEGGSLLAITVEGGRSRVGRRRWIVEINAARRVIASVRPLDFLVEKSGG